MAGAGVGASSGQGCNLCLVVHSAGNAALMQRPIPSPGPTQVLIRVEAVRVQSVCVKLAEGSLLSPSGKPIVPGQEFCGLVVGCGMNVDKSLLDIGHRVAVTPMSFCQRCYFCERGQTNLCESGAELFGWNVDGGYQQYVCVNQKLCHSFDKAVPWRQAVLASTAAAASYGMTKASILPGDSVLIIGTNVVGLMGVVFARGLGAEYICVVGRAGASPDQAMTCGASKFLTWDTCGDEGQQFQQIKAAMAEETEGRGADAVMFPSDHDTGMPDMHMAVKLVRKGGCIINIGICEVQDSTMAGKDEATAAGAARHESIVNRLMHNDLRYICVRGFTASIFDQALRWIEGGLLSMGPDLQEGLPLNAWEHAHSLLGGSRSGGHCSVLHPQADMVRSLPSHIELNLGQS